QAEQEKNKKLYQELTEELKDKFTDLLPTGDETATPPAAAGRFTNLGNYLASFLKSPSPENLQPLALLTKVQQDLTAKQQDLTAKEQEIEQLRTQNQQLAQEKE